MPNQRFYRIVLEVSPSIPELSYRASLRVGIEDGDTQLLGIPWEFTLDAEDLRQLRLCADDPLQSDHAYGELLTKRIFGAGANQALSKWSDHNYFQQGASWPVYFRVRLGSEVSILHEIHWEKLIGPPGSPFENKLLIGEDCHLAREYSDASPRHEIEPKPQPDKVDIVCFAANPNPSAGWKLDRIGSEQVEGFVRHRDHARIQWCRQIFVGERPAPGERRPATLDNLNEVLREAERSRPYILCILCHGLRNGEEGQLVVELLLERNDGTSERRPVSDLVEIIESLKHPPLCAVLLICHSADARSLAPADERNGPDFVALGPALAKLGVPAVLAMQGRVPTEIALRVGARFLREVLEHGQADRAMIVARDSLNGSGLDGRWRPALFLGRVDGRLWAAPPAPGRSTYDEYEPLNRFGTGLSEHLLTMRKRYSYMTFLPLRSFLARADLDSDSLYTEIDRIYVDLDVVSTSPMVDTKGRPVLEALVPNASERPFYILTGEPGAGKTTFIHYLMIHLAYVADSQSRDEIIKKSGMVKGLSRFGVLVPVYIKFAEYVQWFVNRADKTSFERSSSEELWNYLRQNSSLAIDKLADVRARGRFWFFVDAIDEVPFDETFVNAINSIFKALTPQASGGSHNRLLITCRSAIYQKSSLQRTFLDCRVYELKGLIPDQQKNIISKWYDWLGQKVGDFNARRPFADLRRELIEQIDRNEFEDIRSNPLLLTMLILVHAFQDDLPQQFVELYERCIDYLLHWRTQPQPESLEARQPDQSLQVKSLGWVLSANGQSVSVPIFRDAITLIAYMKTTLERESGSGERKKIVDRIKQALDVYLEKSFLISHMNTDRPDDALWDIVSFHGDALVQLKDGWVEFRHKTFSEYLTAQSLLNPQLPLEEIETANLDRDLVSRVLRCLGKGGEKWLPVVRMAAQILLNQRRSRDLLHCIDALVRSSAANPGQHVLLRAAGELLIEHAAVLGDGLAADDGYTRDWGKEVVNRAVEQIKKELLTPSESLVGGVGKLYLIFWELINRFSSSLNRKYTVREILQSIGEFSETEHEQDFVKFHLQAVLYTPVDLSVAKIVERFEIGRALAQIGDPRPGIVDLAIQWVDLTHQVSISRYPITLGQFLTFYDDEGYTDARYWSRGTSEGFELDTQAPDLEDRLTHIPEPRLLSVLRKQPALASTADATLDSVCRPFLNIPICYITYFEAVAFCSWLMRRPPYQASTIRLPTPEEWRAAGSPAELSRQAYSVSAIWRDLLLNDKVVPSFTANSGAEDTSQGIHLLPAVGLFPSLAPGGAQDLGLLINEWCHSERAAPISYSPVAPVVGRSPGADEANARIRLSDLGFRVVRVRGSDL